MFVSISFRLLMNLESLNSVESIGNLVRHRTAPIVISTDNGYVIRFVPAVSGESLAHAYQMCLVDEAKRLNLSLTEESMRGEFLKFADNNLLTKYGIPVPKSENQIRRTEVQVLLKDVVCDIGGFLYAGDFPVKRTSLFQVGYMIPALNDVRATALETQFHVRHAPSSMEQYQAPYNVEVGSAVYTFTFAISFDYVAKPMTAFGERDEAGEKELMEQRDTRIKAAVAALASFITLLPFGAKKSRFMPNLEYLSAVAACCEGASFLVSPGNDRAFVKETVERAGEFVSLMERIKGGRPELKLVSLDKEGAAEGLDGIEVVKNPEAFAKRIVEIIDEASKVGK
jgi:CRISPR-associated protein Csa2